MELTDRIYHGIKSKRSARYWADSENRKKRCLKSISDPEYLRQIRAEGHDIRIYDTEEAYKYYNQNKCIKKLVSDKTSSTVLLPFENVEDLEEGVIRIEEVPCNPIYLAEVDDACVVGNIDTVIAGDKCLSDALSWGRSSILGAVTDKGRCVIEADFKRAKHIPCAIDLKKAHSNNYYHYLYESLSRFQYVEEYPMS